MSLNYFDLNATSIEDRFAANIHGHAIADITNLQSTLDGYQVDLTSTTSIDADNVTIFGNIVPDASNTTATLGSTSNHFSEAWIDSLHLAQNTLYLGDTPVLGTNTGTVEVKADPDQGITVKTTGTGESKMISENGIEISNSGMNGQITVQATGAGGSIAFGALPRIVLAAAKIEDDSLPEGTRLFARAKSNIGPDSGGWHYRLNTTELKEYQDVFTSEVLWGNEVEGSARELLAAADSNDEDGGSALEEAKTFLQSELSLGPVAVKSIMDESRKAGISERTLKRAKAALKVKAEKGGFDKGWQWVLPEICMKDAKHHEEGQQNRVAPFGNVGTLREEITKNDEQVLILKDDDFIFDEPIQEELI